MNVIRNIIIAVLFIVILSGCKSSVQRNLISTIDDECGDPIKSNCLINFKDVTKFNWDKMYLFPDWTISDSIASRIGFSYYGDDVADDYTRMLFVNDKKVVHEEDFLSLDYYDSSIEFDDAFDSISKAKPYYLPVSKAIFKVEKYKPKYSCKACFVYTLKIIKK